MTGAKKVMRLRINNKGSAIVSVIVVTAFITILATTILYTTGMNYRIKANDYQNKQTFYKAEQALDELKAALVEDVSAAYVYAYGEVAAEYSQLTADERAAEYNRLFVEYLRKLWIEGENSRVKMAGYSNVKALEKYFESKTKLSAGECLALVEPVPNPDGSKTTDGIWYDDKPKAVDSDDDAKKVQEGQFIIRNVVVKHVENGYITYIRTDIALNAPEYNWNGSAAPAGDGVLRMSDYVVYTNWTKY